MKERLEDIVIACCRDEADIITSFVDFYLDLGFDRVCLVDNGSRDATMELIEQHPRRDRISSISDDRPGYDKRLLDYYQRFANEDTRWVFFIDVDEFISLPGGIKEYARTLPDDVNVLKLTVYEMFPESLSPAGQHPLMTTLRERDVQRDHKYVWKHGNVTRICCGKHCIDIEPHVEHCDPAMHILHYPVRSRDQLITKMRNRLETDAAISASERTLLSAYPSETAEEWVAYSRRCLEEDGWALECERAASTPTVEDTRMRDWVLSRLSDSTKTEISPVIDVPIGGATWRVFCVRQCDPRAGHTSSEHLVMVLSARRPLLHWGDPLFAGDTAVPVRIHSECVLGDIFGSGLCDCSVQLRDAINYIEVQGEGIIIYLRQEGRGIGLLNKLRSIALREPDSFRRNEALGLPADSRDYELAGAVLRTLGVRTAVLLSGNPNKLRTVESVGVTVQMICSVDREGLPAHALSELQSKVRRGYFYDVD